MAGSARDEAERLVAAIIARAASAGVGAAARGFRDSGNSGGTTSAGARGSSSAPGAASSSASGASRSGSTVSGAAAMVGGAVDGFFGVLNDVARGGSQQGKGDPGSGWATGSPECCVCPVCKAIAAVRDPSPETIVKVATGAGDMASGAAGMLRGLSSLAGSVLNDRSRPTPKPSGGGAARHAPSPDQAWSAATRTPAPASTPATATSGPAPASADSPATTATGSASASPGGSSSTGAAPAGSTSAGSVAPGPAASGRPATTPATPDRNADPWAAATAESAREAEAARARARAAERAVAQAVADARRVTSRKPRNPVTPDAVGETGADVTTAPDSTSGAADKTGNGAPAATDVVGEAGGSGSIATGIADKTASTATAPNTADKAVLTDEADKAGVSDSGAAGGNAPKRGAKGSAGRAKAVAGKGESAGEADPAAGKPAVRKAGEGRRKPGGDVWSVVTSEAAADDAAGRRSVDHERGAEAPEDRGARPGDDARGDDAV